MPQTVITRLLSYSKTNKKLIESDLLVENQLLVIMLLFITQAKS